jgi:hypothetical protein
MYNYENEKHEIFTGQGQKMFSQIRDKTNELFRVAGAARLQEMIGSVGFGSSWTMLACVDRLVELKEILEVTASNGVAGQHRVFVKN